MKLENSVLKQYYIYIIFSFLTAFSWFVFPSWAINIVCISLCNGLVVLGLLVLVRAGLISFGHGLYFCLGGYSVALSYLFLGIKEAIFLIIISMIICFLASMLLGFFIRKYRGIFFAMLNLAFSMILFGIIVKSVSLGSTDGFGIKNITILGFSSPNGNRLNINMYMLIVFNCLLAIYILRKYLNSSAGMIVEAIRENEIRVEYLGINVAKQIHRTYIISSVLAGLGGALTILLIGHITPEDTAYWTKSGEFVFVAILSGSGSVLAPFIGSLFFEFVRSYALFYSPDAWQMILGITLLLGIIFVPEGIWSIIDRLYKKKDKNVT